MGGGYCCNPLLFSQAGKAYRHGNRHPKMEPANCDPITTLGDLEDYWEVPFVGFFGGSGHLGRSRVLFLSERVYMEFLMGYI